MSRTNLETQSERNVVDSSDTNLWHDQTGLSDDKRHRRHYIIHRMYTLGGCPMQTTVRVPRHCDGQSMHEDM